MKMLVNVRINGMTEFKIGLRPGIGGLLLMISLGLNFLLAGFLMMEFRCHGRDLKVFRFLAERHTAEELVRFMGRKPHVYLPNEQLPVRTSGCRKESVFPIEHKVYFYAMPSSARFFVYINKDGTIDRFLCYYD